jgi:hypothetical protein
MRLADLVAAIAQNVVRAHAAAEDLIDELVRFRLKSPERRSRVIVTQILEVEVERLRLRLRRIDN